MTPVSCLKAGGSAHASGQFVARAGSSGHADQGYSRISKGLDAAAIASLAVTSMALTMRSSRSYWSMMPLR